MYTPTRCLSSSGLLLFVLSALSGLQACSSSPHARMTPDPLFGQAVRAALQAQELPPSRLVQPVGVPYAELEQGFESQQKAKPVTTSTRPSVQSPSGLFGQ